MSALRLMGWGVDSVLLPEVRYQLLGLVDAERKVNSPGRKLTSSLKASSLLMMIETRPIIAVSSDPGGLCLTMMETTS